MVRHILLYSSRYRPTNNTLDELLVKTRALNAFQRPSKRDYLNLRTWFFNVKPLNNASEEEFIKRKEDLVSLRHGREWSGFDGFVEACISKMHGPLTQVIGMLNTDGD